MITAYMVGGDSFLAKLKAQYSNIPQEVEKGMVRMLIKLQRNVKLKLSDDVLHVRTGTLRRSINYEVANEGGGLIKGIVGTNVSYAAAHEYGFQGTVNVRQHLRRLSAQVKSDRKGKTRTAGTVVVSAHQREMNIPERSFLRTALAEILPEFKLEMQEAVRRARERK